MVMPNQIRNVRAAKDGSRRLACVAVAFPLLFQLMTKGWKTAGVVRTVEGLPKGALFLTSFSEPKTQTAYFVFHHKSFEEVPIGSLIPMVEVTFQTELVPSQ